MKRIESKELFKTKWITLKQAICINNNNEKFKWDYISRKNDQKIVSLLCSAHYTLFDHIQLGFYYRPAFTKGNKVSQYLKLYCYGEIPTLISKDIDK